MAIFWVLFFKLLPLYLMIGLGAIAAKFLDAQKETVARILIYIITPAVVFYGAVTAPLDASVLILPMVFFAIAAAICLLFLKVGKWAYGSSPAKNILAFAAGSANVGYFGLPVAMLLFDESMFSMAVLSVMGIVIYENTIGFFIAAHGRYGRRASFKKVIKLPAIYAFLIGLAVNSFGFSPNAYVMGALDYFRSAYTLLGMMLIGMGLAAANFRAVDMKFVSLAFLAKFTVWPLGVAALIFMDSHFTHILPAAAYNIMVLMAAVPVAANTVAYAAEFRICCDKAAVAVVASTVFALFYVPLMAGLLQ